MNICSEFWGNEYETEEAGASRDAAAASTAGREERERASAEAARAAQREWIRAEREKENAEKVRDAMREEREMTDRQRENSEVEMLGWYQKEVGEEEEEEEEMDEDG